MSDPERHHYLPVFYLKQWARPDGRVIRYYRPHRKVVAHPIAPKNTAYEPGLYSLEGYKPEQRNIIEKTFLGPEVDDPAAAALRHFLERRPASEFTLEKKQAWTRFLMAMHVRNPRRVEQISEQGVQGIREILSKNPEEYEALRQPGDPPTLVGWVELNAPALIENFGKTILPGIVTHQATGNEISNMKWVVGWRTSGPRLVTSDRPLYLSHGVNDPRCVIGLPLSPDAVFFASRNQASLDNLMRMESSALARATNETVVSQAIRSAYSADDQSLRFVERLLAQIDGAPADGAP